MSDSMTLSDLKGGTQGANFSSLSLNSTQCAVPWST